jgi:Glutaredoxin-like domain (DUF836).
MVRLTLISRTYCHLCHDMERALVPLMQEFAAEMEILDVDADPLLEERYGEIVPVLLHGQNELCRFVLGFRQSP